MTPTPEPKEELKRCPLCGDDAKALKGFLARSGKSLSDFNSLCLDQEKEIEKRGKEISRLEASLGNHIRQKNENYEEVLRCHKEIQKLKAELSAKDKILKEEMEMSNKLHDELSALKSSREADLQKSGELIINHWRKYVEAEKEKVKRLRKRMKEIIWAVHVGIDREGSSESKVRILGIAKEALKETEHD